MRIVLLRNPADARPSQRYLTVAALPATLLLLLLGYLSVRKEIKALFWTFLAGCVAGAAYFVYKVRSPFGLCRTELIRSRSFS